MDDGEYRDCHHCGGSGDDPHDWSGACIFCGGTGEVWVSFTNWDSEDEE